MQFSTFVREARLHQKLLIRELASRAGVNSSYISLVEHGRKNPRIGNAIRIAKALGFNIGMFSLVDEKFIIHGAVKKKYEAKKSQRPRAHKIHSSPRPKRNTGN